MWIMIAGPYRTGARSAEERERNLLALNRAAFEVFRKGHIPILGVNLALPVIAAAGDATYDDIMMPLSLALAERCDGILRLEGVSSGADQEVERVRAHGGHVFRSLAAVPDEAEIQGSGEAAGPSHAPVPEWIHPDAECVSPPRGRGAGHQGGLPKLNTSD